MTRRAGWTARLITTLAVILALTGGASAQDNTPPGPASATVQADKVLHLFTDEALDQTSLPDPSAFTVKIGGTARAAGVVRFCAQNCIAIGIPLPDGFRFRYAQVAFGAGRTETAGSRPSGNPAPRWTPDAGAGSTPPGDRRNLFLCDAS